MIDVPHDFSIEQPYNREIGGGNTGYLIGGIGWYRKQFKLSKEELGKKVFLNIDGIYNRSNIYLNEQFLGFHAFGYAPKLIDVTEYIQEDNVLAIKVDRTRHLDSRWYTGSGIYRKVELLVYEKSYIPLWGVQVFHTLQEDGTAEVTVDMELEHEGNSEQIHMIQEVIDPQGEIIENSVTAYQLMTSIKHKKTYQIKNPMLWDIYKGNMYTLCTTLVKDGKTIQKKETKFGIRSFEFTVDKGFFINGRHEYIKGVCLHHDAGLVGAAVPKDVWPTKANTAGLLDVAGFKKPQFYMFQSLWQDTPSVHMVTQTLEKSLYDFKDDKLQDKEDTIPWERRLWRWHDVNEHYNYAEGDMIVVEAYSNCDELTLYQNDVAISTKYLDEFEDRTYKWCVPYVPGKLEVRYGETSTCLMTTKKPYRVALEVDQKQVEVGFDYVCHVVAQLYDEDNHKVTCMDSEVEFFVSGPARVYGYDNGAKDFVGNHKCNIVRTHHGKAMMIVGAKEAESIEICATLGDKKSNLIRIEVK